MHSSLRILFYGTPEFAAYSLKKIYEANFNIVGVVTAPDKPSGRGLKMKESAVKSMAKLLNIEVLQPANLKSDEFQQDLNRLKPDVQVVIAFRMLPESVWRFPKKGTFNLHASLLPQYRGAAPINHAIINGEKETGVTTFFIEKEIDTGQIILQEKITIEKSDNAGTLHDKLMVIGAGVVTETLKQIESNEVNPIQQDTLSIKLKPAPKIFPKDCNIDFSKSANDVINFIKGLSPYPVARTKYKDKAFKIFDATLPDLDESHKINQGEWFVDKNRLLIGCKDVPILVKSIQQEGKKRLDIEDFLIGFRE